LTAVAAAAGLPMLSVLAVDLPRRYRRLRFEGEACSCLTVLLHAAAWRHCRKSYSARTIGLLKVKAMLTMLPRT